MSRAFVEFEGPAKCPAVFSRSGRVEDQSPREFRNGKGLRGLIDGMIDEYEEGGVLGIIGIGKRARERGGEVSKNPRLVRMLRLQRRNSAVRGRVRALAVAESTHAGL